MCTATEAICSCIFVMKWDCLAVDMLEEPVPGDEEEPAAELKTGEKKKRRRNP